jgi:hypothetical protein
VSLRLQAASQQSILRTQTKTRIRAGHLCHRHPLGDLDRNEITIALALTFDSAKTVTVAAADFRGYAAIVWGAMTTASIVSILPMLLFAAFAQPYIVKGLTLGAVK